MQKSCVKVNNQKKKITFLELKHKYQLVVRLKADKCY